jgi:hypothetical protein
MLLGSCFPPSIGLDEWFRKRSLSIPPTLFLDILDPVGQEPPTEILNMVDAVFIINYDGVCTPPVMMLIPVFIDPELGTVDLLS